jgi:cytidylate kinase
VIVGRLANFILEDCNSLKVFIGASEEAKIKRVSMRENLSEKAAKAKIEKVESERANHCYYFTHKHWRDTSNYDLYIKSDIYGTDETAKLIADTAKQVLNA